MKIEVSKETRSGSEWLVIYVNDKPVRLGNGAIAYFYDYEIPEAVNEILVKKYKEESK